MTKSVTIPELIKDLNLEVIYKGNQKNISIKTSDVNRPGLQLANFFTYFDEGTSERLQVIGLIELAFLNELDAKTRKERLDKYFSYQIPCVILCRGMDPIPDMKKAAIKYERPLLKSELITTEFINNASNYLNSKLAPQMTQHGVLVDVYGTGVLLIGESGIGKSETALELIKRGHRLVSDDVVNIKKVASKRLIGEAPEVLRHFLEIRGIGIIDIKAMYGIGAIINAKAIDLVIELVPWEKESFCDRLGIDETFISFLDVNVHKITIPIKPGRNLAIIIEAAARDFRLKRAGYNAAAHLTEKIFGTKNKKFKLKHFHKL
ncbi:MAG: HPr kinase/phosphorylase [Clostridia bacterium]|mgnify:CR=1 FL=1|jgi:HPr kinase/phosphorylase|nr:HPr kinase/phosphorylase [Clostridia bacterium]